MPIKIVGQLYPNPTSNLFFVSSTIANEQISIIVSDVNGRQLLNKTVNIANYKTGTDVDLTNGIYFVTLVNGKGEKTVKKLVIAK